MSGPYKKCPNCGVGLPAKAVFCRECGAKLHVAEASVAPEPETRRSILKYIVTAVAVAVFAGLGGFYVGRTPERVITKTVEKTIPQTITATEAQTRTVTDVVEKTVEKTATETVPGVTATLTKTVTKPAATVTETVTVTKAPTPTLPTPTGVLSIHTDKPSYMPGEAVVVSGTADANAIVSIQVFDPDGSRVAIAQATADADGDYSATVYTFKTADTAGTWTATAYQGGLTAEASFTLRAS